MEKPVCVYKPPTQHDGTFLSTLQAWGELPNVLHITDVARLLGVLCKQSQKAIYKVLKGAATSGEIEPFGWKLDGSEGHWEKNYIRRLDTLKPLHKKRDGEKSIFHCELVPGQIHWDAIGICPADAVGLLVKRGRTVPPELLDLMPATPAPPVVVTGASDAPATQGNIMKKAALIAALEHDWQSIEADISDATRNGLKTAAHTGKHGDWDKDKAHAWAVSKGKINQTSPAHSLTGAWPGPTKRHTISR